MHNAIFQADALLICKLVLMKKKPGYDQVYICVLPTDLSIQSLSQNLECDILVKFFMTSLRRLAFRQNCISLPFCLHYYRSFSYQKKKTTTTSIQ